MMNKLNLTIPQNWQIISRNALKIIACITMLFDHIGGSIILNLYGSSSLLYTILRFVIGRIAFPIFCTLFIQSIMYTNKVKKHLIILGVFSILSEPCYDLALKHTWVDFTHQNVMLSWFLGCITIALMRKLQEVYEDIELNETVYKLYNILIILLLSVISNFLHVDYSNIIILLCGFIYLLWRSYPTLQFWVPGTIIAVVTGIYYNIPGTVLSIPFMLLYDGTKIQKNTSIKRYSFYIFYPLHLLILGLICQYIC